MTTYMYALLHEEKYMYLLVTGPVTQAFMYFLSSDSEFSSPPQFDCYIYIDYKEKYNTIHVYQVSKSDCRQIMPAHVPLPRHATPRHSHRVLSLKFYPASIATR